MPPIALASWSCEGLLFWIWIGERCWCDQRREAVVAQAVSTAWERLALVDRAEYKRRQAPPGVRVSPKAFGKDRRLPITNRWPG